MKGEIVAFQERLVGTAKSIGRLSAVEAEGGEARIMREERGEVVGLCRANR